VALQRLLLRRHLSILVNNICPCKVWSATRLKWPIVTRAHVPRHTAPAPQPQSFTARSSPPCPGQKPPFLPVKRPARPYKSPIQNRFT
jgi:hypothetical protein